MNTSWDNYSYYSDPTYKSLAYSHLIQAYYITFGSLSAIGNFYLVFLFLIFPKLRVSQCNWLIIFLCFDDVCIGIGILIRGLTAIIVFDNTILEFNYYFCASITALWLCGYRVGQTIAMLMAFDRFLAIWQPALYAKRQGHITIVINTMIILGALGFLIVLFFYGGDPSIPLTLVTCLGIPGIYYLKVVPAYSGVVSIVFVVTYLASLTLFTRTLARTKKQQAHAQNQLSKIQVRIFVSVSTALLFYTIFYVITTFMFILSYYFGMDMNIATIGSYIVFYGAEFNGTLNSIIYLVSHHEFRECHRRFVCGIMRMSVQNSEAKITKVINVTKNAPTSNITCVSRK